MLEIQAPGDFRSGPRPWVFLAGSIEMDTTERWQAAMVRALHRRPGTLLNPRRDDWDASWRQEADEPQFRRQVEWELKAQEQADLILMYFAPGTRSPITLLELGLAARGGKLLVACPEGFWRRGNVELVCRRHGVPFVPDLADLLERAGEWLDTAGGTA